MTKGVKTTKAEYRSVRINPETSQEDADLLKIIQDLEADGWTFKQIVQDAILRSAGHTPEMYSKSASGFILGSIEDMLTRFANEVIGKVQSGGHNKSEPENEDGSVSPFAKHLAKSFMQRQQSKGSDE